MVRTGESEFEEEYEWRLLEVMDVDGEDDRRRELRTLEKEKSRKREEGILMVMMYRLLRGGVWCIIS